MRYTVMTQEKFQEHVLSELSQIKDLFIKNEQDHSILSTKIESVRTEVESVRTEVHKQFNVFLRWTIGTAIASISIVFVLAKYVT